MTGKRWKDSAIMSDGNGNGTVFLSAARTAMGAFGGSLRD